MVNALMIVDPQNDFCEGGTLAVPNSNYIFGYINGLREKINFDYVIITQDWHPKDHLSFAQNHGLPPFSTIETDGEQQMLWPVHCVQNTEGSQISKLLKIRNNEIFVKKGMIKEVQQYSGFGTQNYPTELQHIIRDKKIQEVYVVGLALDYCVGNTALDAKKAGLKVTVIEQCTKGVSSLTVEEMIKKFHQNGIKYQCIRSVIKKLTKGLSKSRSNNNTPQKVVSSN